MARIDPEILKNEEDHINPIERSVWLFRVSVSSILEDDDEGRCLEDQAYNCADSIWPSTNACGLQAG